MEGNHAWSYACSGSEKRVRARVCMCVCVVCARVDVGVMSSSEIRNPRPDSAVFAIYCPRRSVEREVDEGESTESGKREKGGREGGNGFDPPGS